MRHFVLRPRLMNKLKIVVHVVQQSKITSDVPRTQQMHATREESCFKDPQQTPQSEHRSPALNQTMSDNYQTPGSHNAT